MQRKNKFINEIATNSLFDSFATQVQRKLIRCNIRKCRLPGDKIKVKICYNNISKSPPDCQGNCIPAKFRRDLLP